MDGDGMGPVLLHTQPLLLPTKVHIKPTLSTSDSTFTDDSEYKNVK